jgi:hypothetical protein
MKKNLIANSRGMSLGAMLGVITVVMGTALALFSYSVSQTILIDTDVVKTEKYFNAVQVVGATTNIIAREKNTSPTFLAELSAFMGTTITNDPVDPFLIRIGKEVTPTQEVTSYLSTEGIVTSTNDLLLNDSGSATNTTYTLSQYVTPASLLTSYLKEVGFVVDETYPTIPDLVNYIYTLDGFTALPESYFRSGRSYSISNNSIYQSPQYHDEHKGHHNHHHVHHHHNHHEHEEEDEQLDLKVSHDQTLVVAPGKLLVITGDLIVEEGATIIGNYVVKGSVFIAKESLIKATFYVGGDFKSKNKIDLGTQIRPTFVFADENIEILSHTEGTGFFLTMLNFKGASSTIDIIGGVYAAPSKTKVKGSSIEVYVPDAVKGTNFLPEAVPNFLSVVEGGTPGGAGSDYIVFTYPTLTNNG